MTSLTNKYSKLLWLLIILYVASLPYAVHVFNFLREVLTLNVVKTSPLILLLMVCLVYVRTCRLQKTGFRFWSFIAPTTILLCAVVALESNPIKYMHIPQFAVLVYLLFSALNRSGLRFSMVVPAVLYAAALGLLDEVHHGLHPERYFGWEDMIINACGAFIGGLAIHAFYIRPKGLLSLPKFSIELTLPSQLVTIGTWVLVLVSIVVLLNVTNSNQLSTVYPFALLVLNLIGIIISFPVLISLQMQASISLQRELLVFYPLVIGFIIQLLIVMAFFSGIKFQ